MKIRYTATVDGYVVDSEVEEFQIGRWEATLNFTENDERFSKLIDTVSIETQLTDDETEKLLQSNQIQSPNSPTESGKISFGTPEGISTDAEHKLQTIEAFGGLHGIDEVDWKFAEVEVLPESDSERNQLNVLGHNFNQQRRITPHDWEFNLNEFNWELIEELRIPLSFFRRGRQLLDEGDYVNAYTNFYMVLEGMYATSHKNVESQFLQSDELLSVAEMSYSDAIDILGDDLATYFEFYGKERSPKGYLRLLVVIRHQLNHFFGKSGGPHDPNPLEVDRFEPLSNAIMHLTFLLLQMKINEIDIS